MPGVKLTTQAYCKMVLHGAKYPHCAVNGLLVAEKQKPRKEHLPLGGPGAPHTLFVDCIPLFHGTLALAPMLEVALTLVSAGRAASPRSVRARPRLEARVSGGSPEAAAVAESGVPPRARPGATGPQPERPPVRSPCPQRRFRSVPQTGSLCRNELSLTGSGLDRADALGTGRRGQL